MLHATQRSQRLDDGRPNGFRTRHVRHAVAAVLIALLCGAVASRPSPAHAQFGGGGGMGGGQGGGGMGGGGMGGGQGGGGMGGGGGGGGGLAGILIDANGVLRTNVVADAGLSLAHRKAAVAALPPDLRKSSSLRKVALSRLEAAVREAVAAGRGIPDELEKMAGLTRVQYVFVYPATAAGDASQPGEVVIAGPAEPWITDATGRVVGVSTGAPTVLLEDVAAAVRAFPPGQPSDRGIGCSIDPTQEGLASLQASIRRVGRVNPKAGVEEIVTTMRQALGPQQIRIDGVAPTSHFAQVMVEADYRMKLIGIGLERPPVKMSTWIDLARSGSVASNALQRWYFVPNYQCIRISEDDLGIELVGRGVKLVGADEVVMPDGRRMSATRSERATKYFTDAFTAKYPDIAARSPVFAQLRTLIDLAVAAAYLQEHDGYGRTGWAAEALRDEAVYPISRFQTPTQVEPAINAVWRGSRLLTPIGGGVSLQPRMALDPANLLMDESGAVAKSRGASLDLPADRWWWD
jgi:hypothetical protein